MINQSFKNLFNQHITQLIGSQGLGSDCTLIFNNGTTSLCNNCIYDSLSKSSSNMYNSVGPSPFFDGTICPVCMGVGQVQANETRRSINMAVILDSKYFLNLSNKVVNLPNNTIQTICDIAQLNYINNCSELIVDSIPGQSYERYEAPNPCGLGDQKYLITTWRKK
jgi:hypothetical protein